MARSLLNAETHASIVNALRAGAYIKDAAARVGLDESTVHRWINRGDDALLTLGDNELHDAHPEWPYVQFSKSVQEARASARIEAVAMIRTAIVGRPASTRTLDDGTEVTTSEIKPDWRASLAYLERTDPDNWGRVWRGRGRVEDDAPPGAPVDVPIGADDVDAVLIRLDEYIVESRAAGGAS